MSKENSPQSFKFNFDISAYRLLGRELITDRITALFELVKNSYDANAETVDIYFENVSKIGPDSKIKIKDTGLGMELADIQDKWMVVGTDSKRKKRISPAPYKRKIVGQKGVGRFAVDKLGSKFLLKTKKKLTEKKILLKIDWSEYEQQEKIQQLELFDTTEANVSSNNDPKNKKSHTSKKFFTDMENQYWFESALLDEQGTTLEITNIRDIWTENDISRAYKELSKLVMPGHNLDYPFNITIHAPEFKEYHKKQVESVAIEQATLQVELKFDESKNTQEVLVLEEGKLKKKNEEVRPCGFVQLTLFYFDQIAKRKFKKLFPESKIDGIKVYRDGLVATPFAEHADQQDKKKDLLGIDKRRWSGFFDRLATRDLLGWVDITDERNPLIIDATSRQDFVDNQAWQELKKFVIEQIRKIEDFLKEERTIEQDKTSADFENAKNDLETARKDLNSLKKQVKSESVKSQLGAFEKTLAKTQASVNKSKRAYQELQEEHKRREDLFFSLVSLQTYASMFSHIIRTSIGKIIRCAEFLKDLEDWSDPVMNERCLAYSTDIFNEMNRLTSAVDFMLKYAKSGEDLEEVNVKKTLENLFHNVYFEEFEKRQIQILLEVDGNLSINYNLSAFEDIFGNLIGNSFKALEANQQEKLIKCVGTTEKNHFVLYFSDNGCGIPKENRNRVFDVFFTTTAEQGGAGMGLYIVKSRLEAIKGKIEIVENEFKPNGATFRIEIPFKR